MRMFHGVDLDKNYGGMMWNNGDCKQRRNGGSQSELPSDPKVKRSLALKRQFRGYCLRLEREMKNGMFVIDREKRVYQIIEIKGWGIEEKEYWLQRIGTNNMEKKTALEIYPLDWWIREREGKLMAGEKRPLWFRIVDEVKERGGERWTK